MAKKGVTYSEKSDRHESHKHLFGTGGKSDFIINMSVEGSQKLCGVYSITAMILVALSALPYYISKAVNEGNIHSMLMTKDNATLAFLIMTLLVAAGFLGMLFFMICNVKKEIILGKNKSLWLFAGVIVSALISALAAKDKMTSIFGYLDRAEGLITIIGYIGFFAIGMTLTHDKWRKSAGNTIVAIGTFNGVLGILQSIPALSEYIPSYYNYLFIGYKTDIEEAAYFNAYAGYDASYASDGLCCSPFALGALLTVACAFALSNAAFTKKTLERLLNLSAFGIMTAAAITTQTFPAMLGVLCVGLIGFIMAIFNKVKENDKNNNESNPKFGNMQIITVALAGVIALGIFAGIFFTDNFRVRNERIMYTDSFERLNIAFRQHSEHEEGIYPTLWYEGWLTFTDNNVLLGVGPDNWSTMYNSGEGMEIDRTYNEYLDTMLMRGLLGLALQLSIIVITFIKGVRMLKSAAKGNISKQVAFGAFTAFLAYSIQAFFNISTASSTPFFYLAVGLIWSFEARGTHQKA